MSVQTTYTIAHGPGYQGQVADHQNLEIMSGVAEGTVPVGVALTRGALDTGVIVPAADITFRGVSVRSLDLEANSSNAIEYVDGNEVAILTRGTIYVLANETVAVGDPVFFIHTGGDEGKFRTDVDTANATAVVGATFLDAGVAGVLVRIRIPSAVA